MSHSAKKARKGYSQHYRVATAAKQRVDPHAATRPDIPSDQETASIEAISPPAIAAEVAVTPRPADLADLPTIVLSPAEIAVLTQAPVDPDADAYGYWQDIPSEPTPLMAPQRPAPEPPEVASRGNGQRGVEYPYVATRDPYDATRDPPTIVLDVAALLDAPAPSDGGGIGQLLPIIKVTPALEPRARPDVSWPRAPHPLARGPLLHSATIDDPVGDLARLRSQRLSRKLDPPKVMPNELALTGKLRQWWHDIKPGLDRVLGRSHRAGVHGVRATISQTSAQIPAIQLKSLHDDAVPAISPRSSSAKELGTQARDAALPALLQFHARAERAAQRLVDRIDEHMGAKPPMQHILLGPGRMVIAFAPGVSIRNAQYVIAAAQARPLRRIVGYNAYLVLVPPGREARYADRFHGFREVIGVHFGAPPSALIAAPRV